MSCPHELLGRFHGIQFAVNTNLLRTPECACIQCGVAEPQAVDLQRAVRRHEGIQQSLPLFAIEQLEVGQDFVRLRLAFLRVGR